MHPGRHLAMPPSLVRQGPPPSHWIRDFDQQPNKMVFPLFIIQELRLKEVTKSLLRESLRLEPVLRLETLPLVVVVSLVHPLLGVFCKHFFQYTWPPLHRLISPIKRLPSKIYSNV